MTKESEGLCIQLTCWGTMEGFQRRSVGMATCLKLWACEVNPSWCLNLLADCQRNICYLSNATAKPKSIMNSYHRNKALAESTKDLQPYLPITP